MCNLASMTQIGVLVVPGCACSGSGGCPSKCSRECLICCRCSARERVFCVREGLLVAEATSTKKKTCFVERRKAPEHWGNCCFLLSDSQLAEKKSRRKAEEMQKKRKRIELKSFRCT